MSKDPLVESLISTLLNNVECNEVIYVGGPVTSNFGQKIGEINRNLEDLKQLFIEGFISKERINEILVSVRKSKVFTSTHSKPEYDICETTEKVSMFVLKYKK